MGIDDHNIALAVNDGIVALPSAHVNC